MAVLVGKPAPDFTAAAVMGNNSIEGSFNLKTHIKDKYAVIFFYPLDFTFVCPSELIAFDHRLKDFKDRNVEVIGVSIDSQFTHLAWKNTPVNNGGIGQVQYPLVADIKHEICQAYDVEAVGGVAFRGSFLVDKNGVVRHQIVNDLSLGRDIDEMLRMVDALQFTEQHGEVCPAGWSKGKAGMKANTKGVADYLAKHAGEL
ncbi:MAG: alkyl hydroperoxide reductase [Betaproteobacteria bacterium CG2_30_59_46]|nr:MAG: alkyl hydroperoxide reductase [Betaproteobacteria bacterium CG2_30_59_46]PIQ13565.1 MAG: alkyl hydroperoxide reductase [Hydrogenophilales bacterium CG18_big_fil_WC_8_21_14_2_50_58_12]PIX98522.1 MAG: alkyl hydroperoxide reductase [Hydrogenophilales bacterium CG_4_10_14_3_um_filter_58_23]PJB04359.1 MAG: alkyl hydroperoxide reductase [Hydrogenophilales bacterium CG_4_9_14_3_um_filter_59_35]